MRQKIVALLDVNDDGEVNALDMAHIIIRHEWMFVAGFFIFIGAVGNVMDWWTVDSDAFWAAAGLAAMLEYVDDTRRIRKTIRDNREEKS